MKEEKGWQIQTQKTVKFRVKWEKRIKRKNNKEQKNKQLI